MTDIGKHLEGLIKTWEKESFSNELAKNISFKQEKNSFIHMWKKKVTIESIIFPLSTSFYFMVFLLTEHSQKKIVQLIPFIATLLLTILQLRKNHLTANLNSALSVTDFCNLRLNILKKEYRLVSLARYGFYPLFGVYYFLKLFLFRELFTLSWFFSFILTIAVSALIVAFYEKSLRHMEEQIHSLE